MGTTAQTLRAKFHTVLRINCVGCWGKTRTSFRANVEKKPTYTFARSSAYTFARTFAQISARNVFYAGVCGKSRQTSAGTCTFLFFFFAHTRAQASAHICAQKFTRILRDYFARNICAQFFTNLCATRNEKFTPASIETSGGISVASCPPELPHTHARKLRDKP